VELHISLVDRSDLSGEIYRQLRQAILDGRLRPGERLPPSRQLSQSLRVSRTTVTTAYEGLIGQGFLTAQVGVGTFVNDRLVLPIRPERERQASSPLRPRALWDSIPLPTAFSRPAQFDFRTGLPDASLFPFETWRRLMARELRATAVGKGIYGDPAGHAGLREAIARHIGIARGLQVSADDITITNGTQQAVDVVARALLAPRDRVGVEDPGYPPPRWLFESLGAKVRGVPVDRDGLVVDALDPKTRLVYVTPSHQYPLGVPMSLRRRQELLAWAERHNAAIIEDDYDSEFRFYGRPLEPLRALDSTGRVIYVGSFSKTMLPVLRVGFVLTPRPLTRAVQAAKFVTDWHSSIPTQGALASFIEDGGFARHVRKMRGVYEERHRVVIDLIGRTLGEFLQVMPSAAGLHISAVARTASVDKIHAIVARASDAGVEVHKLSSFAFDHDPRPGLAIGYGAIAASRIAEGGRRLRRCFDEMGSTAPAPA
jgi:GntR family transcriptional regulator/MocR family aminotransferase